MAAIAFDLVVAEAQKHHPKGIAQAYADIKFTLAVHGFDWVQGACTSTKQKTSASFSTP